MLCQYGSGLPHIPRVANGSDLTKELRVGVSQNY